MFQINKNEVYVIAEIGQNHNGDINIAKKLIDQLDVYPYDEISGNRLNKINAIKLTKRDLTEELSKDGMEMPYDNPNSFGATYGKHRQALELSYEEHVELGEYIKSKGFDFIETLCSVKTLKLLDMAPIDKIKLASRDLTNIPLLIEIAKRDYPVIISTGMASEDDISMAMEILKDKDVSILHCLSQYPAEYSRLNMRSMEKLKELYPNRVIGYSDHSLGIHIPSMAVAMGAAIIEKHVTLDKSMKGTDQKGSAEPQEVKQMMHNIRTIEMSFGERKVYKDSSTIESSKKLERSLAVNKDIPIGRQITESDLHMISPGDGLRWDDRDVVVGKTLVNGLKQNQLIKIDNLK